MKNWRPILSGWQSKQCSMARVRINHLLSSAEKTPAKSAPSVALATLAMTVVSDGSSYAAIEGRSMMAAAIAFFVYAFLVSRIMMRYKYRAIFVTLCLIPVWVGVAGASTTSPGLDRNANST